MATTTGSFKLYDSFLEYVADGTIDLDSDTFKVTLHTSSYGALDTTHLSDDSVYADVTNELSTANGYTNGGETLTSVTWIRSGATTTLDCADPTWTISGGSVVARYFIIRKSGTANSITDPLVGVGYLDSSPADVTTTTGNTLTITINAAGLLTFTKA